jgi:hypothetical protein
MPDRGRGGVAADDGMKAAELCGDAGGRAHTAPIQPTESAVRIAMPEAEDVVDRFRVHLDRSAAWGVPPHVTVLYPSTIPNDPAEQLTARRSEAVHNFESSRGHSRSRLSRLRRCVRPGQLDGTDFVEGRLVGHLGQILDSDEDPRPP